MRWSDATRIDLLVARPGLPDAWWRSLPLSHVLTAHDPSSLGELLTDLAMEHWPAAAVGDLLPALYVLDPDEADDPQVTIALNRTGSWPGLLSLSARELADQPFINARPMLAALFTTVFERLSPSAALSPAGPSAAAGRPGPMSGAFASGAFEPPAVEPLAVEPPAVEPPAAEPPAIERAAVETPAIESPASGSPAAEPQAPRPRALEPSAPGLPDSAGFPDSIGFAGPAGSPVSVDLPALIDSAFADLDDQTWMVAQNRVFTSGPSSVEDLARLLAVSPDVITALEAALRARLAEWLTLPVAEPYREHLAGTAEALGTAAPLAHLAAVADWHGRELRFLEVPAWQFVLATLPGYRVSGDWLVAADPAELRERTRRLIAEAEPPPTVARAVELVASLGIRPDVAKQWLETVPQIRIQSGSRPSAPPDRADRREAGDIPGGIPGEVPDGVPGALPGGDASEGPPGGIPFGLFAGPPAELPSGLPAGLSAGLPAGLKDVALTRRCFRQPDGRWWLRVDVTGAHLSGGEVSLPTGFAAYLGLAPGTSRVVRSSAGAVVLAWHAHPVLRSMERLLTEVAAEEDGHLFLTLSEEGMLRVRHLPAAQDGETTRRALRLVGYTAPGRDREQAERVIATRIGLTHGQADREELLARLRERGDRDLLELLG
ncbi:hypothetical protein ACQP1K_23915 [Sphaerimonospora sp. CA-214678]|uniref:hypothetical protein n=1 Tax=Sphaerimonospora sp. CA-214678 TaxID=3240029 RepID=UPI003D8C6C47